MSALGKFSALYRKPARRTSDTVDLDRLVEMLEEEAAVVGRADFDAQAAIIEAARDRSVPPALRAAAARAIAKKVDRGDAGG